MNLPKIEVSLQPTEEQIKAGVNELASMISVGDMEVGEIEDVVVFVWQAMIAER